MPSHFSVNFKFNNISYRVLINIHCLMKNAAKKITNNKYLSTKALIVRQASLMDQQIFYPQ